VWQQAWWYHEDGRFELSGRNLCFDVPDGNPYRTIQMWECIVGNKNQQWEL
jgi:hypothetical protein